MSKVTDRLDNKQLVELAKKQYEQSKQINKFPANIVKFPSAGKVYPESSPLRKGEIEMRHMTAYDEDILTNSTYISNGVIFDKLLESLIITPGVNVDDLIYTDKESLIVSARILGYGNDYIIVVQDKNDKPIKATIDLTKLNFKPFDLTSDENGCFTYQTQNAQEIKYRLLSESEVIAIDSEKQVSDYLNKSIYSVNGDTNKKTIQDFIKYELIAMESRKLRLAINENIPGIDSNTQAIGEDGGTYSAVFQFSADLFRV